MDYTAYIACEYIGSIVLLEEGNILNKDIYREILNNDKFLSNRNIGKCKYINKLRILLKVII